MFTKELINKLKKSALIFQIWEQKKLETINNKNKTYRKAAKNVEEESQKLKEKRAIALKAFEKWKERKDETLQETLMEKKEQEEKIRKEAKKIKNKKKKAEEAFESW